MFYRYNRGSKTAKKKRSEENACCNEYSRKGAKSRKRKQCSRPDYVFWIQLAKFGYEHYPQMIEQAQPLIEIFKGWLGS